MAWIETDGGDFLNLQGVLALQAEKVPTFPEGSDEIWGVVAILSEVEEVPLAGNWANEKAAQTWIRGVLLGAGEKIAGHVVIR